MKKWTLKEVEEHYESLADHYDEVNVGTDAHMRRFIDGFSLSNVKDNSYVLDVFCRTGKGTLYFAERGKVKKMVGLDVSSSFLSIAKKRLEEKKIKFELKKLKTMDFPLEDNTFDEVLSFETLEHVPNPEKYVSEIHRVLKPGGELILTTPNTAWEIIHELVARLHIHHSEGPHKFVPRKDIIKMLQENGFKIKKEETTVLIPQGPEFLLRLGNFLENILKDNLMRLIGLRRIFICEKPE